MEPPISPPCDSVGPSPAPPHQVAYLHHDHRQVELGAGNRRPSDQPHVSIRHHLPPHGKWTKLRMMTWRDLIEQVAPWMLPLDQRRGSKSKNDLAYYLHKVVEKLKPKLTLVSCG